MDERQIRKFERELLCFENARNGTSAGSSSNPTTPEHVASLREALQEGWDDPDRPGMARETWELFALKEV